MEEVLPNALMIGVDYNLFWDLNPKTLSPFVKAFSLKQKYDDTIAWQHGYYVYCAIGSSFSKNNKYPKTPMFTAKPHEDTPEERMQLIKERFIRHAKMLNSKMGKEDIINGE